ncbi:hypothetical protein [Comamonas kerstersii]|uniref:hypothetical protein n=1 Tax=Comamonas kerstersii TaxID=225992 RepID=UPI0026DC6D80|nr:hypothetical protein [Comamonas kerstersii]
MKKHKVNISSMTSNQSFLAATLFVAALFLIILITAIGDKLLCWINENSGLASWVQAIGSVAAIGGIWWQTKENYKNNQKDRKVDLYGVQLEVMAGITMLNKRFNKFLYDFDAGLLKICDSNGNIDLNNINFFVLERNVASYFREFSKFANSSSGAINAEEFIGEICFELDVMAVKINKGFPVDEVRKSIKMLKEKSEGLNYWVPLEIRQLKDLLGYK